jgi:hypothetical protein
MASAAVMAITKPSIQVPEKGFDPAAHEVQSPLANGI